MSSRSVRIALPVALLALARGVVALEPSEFVAGWPIHAPSGAEVFDVPLTAEVYAVADTLERVAVFDANGTALAFFRRTVPAPVASERRVTLAASPVYAGTPAGGAAVGVTTSVQGTSVTVSSGTEAAPVITGFVLDARAVDAAPSALELEWRALPQPFLLDVRVEQSENLTDWRGVGSAAVATLAIDGNQVRHTRVPVRASVGGYLRVIASRAVEGWYLERATLVSSAAESPMPLVLPVAPLAASALADDADSTALYFDVGGALPVTALALRFAADTGWVRADIAASASLAGPWIPVASGQLFYALAFEGQELVSEPLGIGRREARYWRVRPVESLRGQSIELAVHYPQEQLRVAARGAAPYLLAAGTLSDDAGPDPTFAAVWSAVAPDASSVAVATLGTRRELGGPAVLVAAKSWPWRALALWAVLIGGVLVVGFMAVRLAREMQSKST